MSSLLSSDIYRVRRIVVFIAVVALVPAAAAVAGGAAEGAVNSSNGIAIGGYDPVAYFTLGEPTIGNAEHSFAWDGAEWRFASAKHLEMFAEDPERYAPSYGGYCAFAAARNQVAYGDPALWTIHEGRLFLNLNPRVERQFHDDIDAMVEDADVHWPELRAGLAAAAAED